jgi:hypothetical protein
VIWQDIVISAASVVLALSLVPQVYVGFKKKIGPIAFATSLPTCVSLFVVCGAFWTLSLRFSAAVTLATATMWFVLFLQRLMYERPVRKNDARGV